MLVYCFDDGSAVEALFSKEAIITLQLAIQPLQYNCLTGSAINIIF
jgi:hypothetical protein